jgi:hypothetical protein
VNRPTVIRPWHGHCRQTCSWDFSAQFETRRHRESSPKRGFEPSVGFHSATYSFGQRNGRYVPSVLGSNIHSSLRCVRNSLRARS